LELQEILHRVKQGELSPGDAEGLIRTLAALPGRIADLGFANLDLDREKRTGFPEVIYGLSKTAEQIISIIQEFMKHSKIVLATRVDSEKAAIVMQQVAGLHYHSEASLLTYSKNGAKPKPQTETYTAVLCAGSSDLPVAEEAALIAEYMGVKVERIYDVGVAGIHRLFSRLDVIRGAEVVIVVAGMEGALPSVVGGLVSSPVVAVPTSVGYGANLQGIAALLSMINACAPGIAVVNIDNGFGAGYYAANIIKRKHRT
jgi:NCAIR mutase (PurE)-related protein